MVKYFVPAHLIGQRVRVPLRASCVVVFEGRSVIATYPRLGTRGVTRVELDHYLEVLRHKPGAFTAAHDAFWAAARQVNGDVADPQELIDVLLLHRSLPTDAVAVEARGHTTTSPTTTATGGTVVNLPPRRRRDPAALIAALPADTRPLPSVTTYDELLRRRTAPDPSSDPATTAGPAKTGTP